MCNARNSEALYAKQFTRSRMWFIFYVILLAIQSFMYILRDDLSTLVIFGGSTHICRSVLVIACHLFCYLKYINILSLENYASHATHLVVYFLD